MRARLCFLGLFGCVVLPLPATGTEAVQSIYQGRLEPTTERAVLFDELLTDGFNRRVSIGELRSGVARALSQTDQDPSVTYAYALSLLKRGMYDDALRELIAARGSSDQPYHPAWRASIWLLMTRKRYDEGFDLLTRFAEMQMRTDIGWSSPAVPLENARWIGRLLAGLDLDAAFGGKARVRQEETYVAIEGMFPKPHRAALQMGVDDALRVRAELEARLNRAADEAGDARRAEIEKEKQDLADEKLLAEKKKEELKLTAEEWKQKLDAALLDFGKRIGEKQREYTLLDTRRQTLAQSIIRVQQQVTLLQAFAPTPAEGSNVPGFDFQQQTTIQQLAALQQQLISSQLQYNATLADMEQVRLLGMQILGERAALIDQYQKATGQLVKQDQAIDKLSKKFETKEAELAGDAAAPDSRETRRIEQRLKSFQTYVAFDLDSERQQLIDAHTPLPVLPNEEQP